MTCLATLPVFCRCSRVLSRRIAPAVAGANIFASRKGCSQLLPQLFFPSSCHRAVRAAISTELPVAARSPPNSRLNQVRTGMPCFSRAENCDMCRSRPLVLGVSASCRSLGSELSMMKSSSFGETGLQPKCLCPGRPLCNAWSDRHWRFRNRIGGPQSLPSSFTIAVMFIGD